MPRRSTNLDLGPLRRSASTFVGQSNCRRSEGPESALPVDGATGAKETHEVTDPCYAAARRRSHWDRAAKEVQDSLAGFSYVDSAAFSRPWVLLRSER